jgi:hypothetical protein
MRIGEIEMRNFTPPLPSLPRLSPEYVFGHWRASQFEHIDAIRIYQSSPECVCPRRQVVNHVYTSARLPWYTCHHLLLVNIWRIPASMQDPRRRDADRTAMQLIPVDLWPTNNLPDAFDEHAIVHTCAQPDKIPAASNAWTWREWRAECDSLCGLQRFVRDDIKLRYYVLQAVRSLKYVLTSYLKELFTVFIMWTSFPGQNIRWTCKLNGFSDRRSIDVPFDSSMLLVAPFLWLAHRQVRQWIYCHDPTSSNSGRTLAFGSAVTLRLL